MAGDGKTVVFKAEKKPRPKNRLGKPIYTGETCACLENIWRFYWYKCGPYLACLIRQNIDFLMASKKPDFPITPELRAPICAISGRQIDRLLKPAKDAMRFRGISGTTSASESLLKKSPSAPITATKSEIRRDFAKPTRFTTAATVIREHLTSPLPSPTLLPAGCGSTGCSTRPMPGRWRA
jgi:hypothetical protein